MSVQEAVALLKEAAAADKAHKAKALSHEQRRAAIAAAIETYLSAGRLLER